MSIFGAEVIGTALLILLGNGVVACVLLNLSGEQSAAKLVPDCDGMGVKLSTYLDRTGEQVGSNVALRPHEGLVLG